MVLKRRRPPSRCEAALRRRAADRGYAPRSMLERPASFSVSLPLNPPEIRSSSLRWFAFDGLHVVWMWPPFSPHPLQPRGWWKLTGPASSALSFISMWVSWWWLLVSFKSVAVVMNGGRIMFSSMPGCTCTISLLLSAILCTLCLASSISMSASSQPPIPDPTGAAGSC